MLRASTLALIFSLAVLLGMLSQGVGGAQSLGGTQINNIASATFNDGEGNTYETNSNVVIATINKLGAITVTPKELAANPATDSVPVGQNATRIFTISNTSNIPDAYQITALSAAPLTIISIAFLGSGGTTPITIGSTTSPTIAPGGSIQVQVTLSTSNLRLGTAVSISLTAQTTVSGTSNGVQSDSGEQWIVAGTPPALAGPGSANAIPQKLVNHITSTQSQPGGTVTFSIIVKNYGSSPATNVMVIDPFPAGLTPQISSVTLNGAPAGAAVTLSGQTLTVVCGTLYGGATDVISVDATTPNLASLGTTLLNTAGVSADGLPLEQTTPASVFLGSANIVYDGFDGGSHPLAGATVTLLDANGSPVHLSSFLQKGNSGPLSTTTATAGACSGNTTNPCTTGPDGNYGFDLLVNQISAQGSRFYLTISLPGYINRKIALDITPATGTDNLFYNVALTSFDQQPVAQAGGFDLTTKPIALSHIFGLFGNLPMFTTRAITVTKTADRPTARAGDRLKYEIDAFEDADKPLLGGTVNDLQSPGLIYASGTALVDGVPSEPSVNGQTLTWQLGQLNPGVTHRITYFSIVSLGVTPGQKLTNNVSVGGTVPGTHVSINTNSSVTVIISSSILSARRPLTGRVFYDTAKTGHFMPSDTGIANVRIFLEDGSSALTDPDGRFSFPALRPGVHVLQLDRTTLPPDAVPYLDQRMNSSYGMQQLVHGILDYQILDDVEFALMRR